MFVRSWLFYIEVVLADNSVAMATIHKSSHLYVLQGITVKAVNDTENSERIIVARILSGGLAHTFGK